MPIDLPRGVSVPRSPASDSAKNREPAPPPEGSRSGSGCYEIRVRNHIDLAWLEHFGGMSSSNEGEDVSVPTGVVADQAALHGLLARVRDLGLPLLSLRRVGGRGLLGPKSFSYGCPGGGKAR